MTTLSEGAPAETAATPSTVTGTVTKRQPPRRRRNADVRPREHLTPAEVFALMKAARKRGRYGHRDATAVLLAWRHGLRISELCGLTWHDVNLREGTVAVRRLKGSASGVHPLRGDEVRALRRLRREQRDGPEAGNYVFASERGGPISAAGFRKMLQRTGVEAGFAFIVHPHQLRHACGYSLANAGTDVLTIAAYLGHRQIANTRRYAEISPARFRSLTWAEE
jgi:integrase